MQYVPGKVSVTQLVLSFLRSVYGAVAANQYNAAYIFTIFLSIVEVATQIKSCVSRIQIKNHISRIQIKNLYNNYQNGKICVPTDLAYLAISRFTRPRVVHKTTFEGSLSEILCI
jgi:hypothetical protein